MSEDTKKDPKRLYRSNTDKKVFGVCGGMAEYFGVDATMIRLLTVVLTVFSGFVPGILAYIFAALIMPEPAA